MHSRPWSASSQALKEIPGRRSQLVACHDDGSWKNVWQRRRPDNILSNKRHFQPVPSRFTLMRWIARTLAPVGKFEKTRSATSTETHSNGLVMARHRFDPALGLL
jgi:hypothetical protein